MQHSRGTVNEQEAMAERSRGRDMCEKKTRCLLTVRQRGSRMKRQGEQVCVNSLHHLPPVIGALGDVREMHTHTPTHTHTHTHTLTNPHAQTHRHIAHIHTNTHTHTLTQTHTLTDILLLVLPLLLIMTSTRAYI